MLDTLVINKCVLRTLSLNINIPETLRSPENRQIDGLYIKIENGEVVNVATDSLYMHKASASLSNICNDESMLEISGKVIIPFESLRLYFRLADLNITSNGDWVFLNRVVWESWCRLSKMPTYICADYNADYNKATNKSFQKTGLSLYRWLIDTINTHSVAFDSFYFYKYKPTQEVYLFGVVKEDDRLRITRISYVGKYAGKVTKKIKLKGCFLNPSHLVGFSGKDVEVEICDDSFNFRMDFIPKEYTDSNVVSIFKNYTKDDKKTIKRMCKELLEGKED